LKIPFEVLPALFLTIGSQMIAVREGIRQVECEYCANTVSDAVRQGGQLWRRSTINERVSGGGVLAAVALADARASDTCWLRALCAV